MKHRWVAIAVVTSTAVAAATCVRDDLVECAGGFSCPVGLRCVEDPALSQSSCASDDQFAACTLGSEVAQTGTRCMLGEQSGTCFGGACIVEVCGDAIVQGREACDDGNTIGSDGCSANCVSTEACGDSVIDLLQGEQCDDGVRGLSGDGCSSNCKIEYAFWRDVTPPFPGSRYSYGFAQSPNGRILLYGGTSGSAGNAERASYGDTWEHDGVTWGRLDPPMSPSPLSRASLAYDPRRNRVVMFGGVDANAIRRDDTWEFDGVTWTQLAPATKPPARVDAAFACSPNRCVMFGGLSGSGTGTPRSDSWMWDGTTWSEIPTSGSGTPNASAGAGMTYDQARDVFVLWGGHTGSGAISDTREMPDALPNFWQYQLDGPPGVTFGLPAIAYSPTTRQTWVTMNGMSFTYAGEWGSGAQLSPTQNALAWNPRTQQLTATANTQLDRTYTQEGSGWTPHNNIRPTGQRTATTAYDSLRGLTMIYERLDGTWEWDGTVYRQAAPASSLTAPNVEDAAMVFDEACGDLILFGGYNLSSNNMLADTWRFDGTKWQKLPIAGPPGRSRHAMFYDPVRNATILFGGAVKPNTSLVRAGDTWQLAGPCNARVWTELAVTGPTPRFVPAAAFDRARDVGVLFGGDAITGSKNDIWEWDGGTWVERLPAESPAARNDAGLAFDPRLRRIVLANGRIDELTRLSDVWTWDGTAWAELVPLVVPPARSGAKLVEDRTGNLVMYGGETVMLPASVGLQRLRFDQAQHPSERCQLATADDDRDGLIGCDDPDCRSRCAPGCSAVAPFAQCSGPRCGDGTCSAIEDHQLCPADCPS